MFLLAHACATTFPHLFYHLLSHVLPFAHMCEHSRMRHCIKPVPYLSSIVTGNIYFPELSPISINLFTLYSSDIHLLGNLRITVSEINELTESYKSTNRHIAASHGYWISLVEFKYIIFSCRFYTKSI